jgi:hypothetical protein
MHVPLHHMHAPDTVSSCMKNTHSLRTVTGCSDKGPRDINRKGGTDGPVSADGLSRGNDLLLALLADDSFARH